MSAAMNALRRAVAVAPQGARAFQSSAARLGGHADEPAYLHAKHMYNITEMTNRKAKIGGSIVAIIVSGYAIPLVAVKFTQAKTKG